MKLLHTIKTNINWKKISLKFIRSRYSNLEVQNSFRFNCHNRYLVSYRNRSLKIWMSYIFQSKTINDRKIRLQTKSTRSIIPNGVKWLWVFDPYIGNQNCRFVNPIENLVIPEHFNTSLVVGFDIVFIYFFRMFLINKSECARVSVQYYILSYRFFAIHEIYSHSSSVVRFKFEIAGKSEEICGYIDRA